MAARLYVAPERLAAGTVTISGEDHRHLVRVLRLAAGDAVVVFDGCGNEVEAIIRNAGPREAELALGVRRRSRASATPPLTLLLGISRGERMDLTIQKTTELGVARIVPVVAARTTAGQQPRTERWRKIAREAARQCGRADLPDLAEARPLQEAVTSTAAGGGTRLICWEEAGGGSTSALPLRRALPPSPESVTILIGPEGGLTVEEVDHARAAAFQVATLGPRVLRAETAAIAAVAIVQSLLGGMD